MFTSNPLLLIANSHPINSASVLTAKKMDAQPSHFICRKWEDWEREKKGWGWWREGELFFSKIKLQKTLFHTLFPSIFYFPTTPSLSNKPTSSPSHPLLTHLPFLLPSLHTSMHSGFRSLFSAHTIVYFRTFAMESTKWEPSPSLLKRKRVLPLKRTRYCVQKKRSRRYTKPACCGGGGEGDEFACNKEFVREGDGVSEGVIKRIEEEKEKNLWKKYLDRTKAIGSWECKSPLKEPLKRERKRERERESHEIHDHIYKHMQSIQQKRNSTSPFFQLLPPSLSLSNTHTHTLSLSFLSYFLLQVDGLLNFLLPHILLMKRFHPKKKGADFWETKLNIWDRKGVNVWAKERNDDERKIKNKR